VTVARVASERKAAKNAAATAQKTTALRKAAAAKAAATRHREAIEAAFQQALLAKASLDSTVVEEPRVESAQLSPALEATLARAVVEEPQAFRGEPQYFDLTQGDGLIDAELRPFSALEAPDALARAVPNSCVPEWAFQSLPPTCVGTAEWGPAFQCAAGENRPRPRRLSCASENPQDAEEIAPPLPGWCPDETCRAKKPDHVNPSKAKFCILCGTKLESPPPSAPSLASSEHSGEDVKAAETAGAYSEEPMMLPFPYGANALPDCQPVVCACHGCNDCSTGLPGPYRDDTFLSHMDALDHFRKLLQFETLILRAATDE